MHHDDILRHTFANICDGYSSGRILDKFVYIKHLGYREHLNFETVKQKYYDEARASGLQTIAEKIESLNKKGIWTKKDEDSVARQQDTIERFKQGRKTIHLPSMLKAHDQNIKNLEAELAKLQRKKNELVGLTVESHADKLANDYYILKNLFIDEEFSEPFLTEDEFDNLEDSVISEIIDGYNDIIEICSDDYIKKLSIQEFFQEYFYICGDDLSSFFGKPISKFTYYQIRLGNYAKQFKHIFENNDLSNMSKETRANPDAIIDYVNTKRNAESVIDKQKGSVVGIVGGTKDDYKQLGISNSLKQMPNKDMNKEELISFWSNAQ